MISGTEALVEVEEDVKVIPGGNAFITKLGKLVDFGVNWSRLSSIWPATSARVA